ncbi:TonB-dependent receptor [Methylobacterium durans]|uniref:TonB-dependent receptor n=1 Tax=Methylobacterium durans TaxID=2202825 RepID=UPI002B001501|nr:TonB-dependent receptor [Methylobacterium durans]MEA1831557.1 TonB-dependent receptor [Methylobacterium durans]
MRYLFVSTTALLVVTAPAAAQAPSIQAVELDQLSVTAARAERSVSDIPQSVQIVGRQEIEQQLKQNSSASAALSRLVPGFSVSNQSVSGASETYRGRDLLVLLDGVPLNTPLRDVNRILALIDLNSVDRIELVAGASSLYGAGATGGTVNFITKQAEPGPPRVTVNAATRAFTSDIAASIVPELSTTVSGRNPDGFDYVFTGTGRMGRRTYDGIGRELPSDAMLGQGGGDRFGSGNVFAKLGYDIDAAKRIEGSFAWFSFNQDPRYLTNYSAPYARPILNQPYPGLSILEDTKSLQLRYTDRDFALGSLSLLGYYNSIEKRFNFTTFSYPYNSQVYYSFDPLRPTSPNNQTMLFSDRGGINATIDTPLDDVWAGARLTWGADLILEKTNQTLTNGQNVFTPLQQTTTAAFGLLQVPVTESLTVRGGVRYEYFALNVEDFLRPAAYAAVAARTPLGYQAFVLPALRVTGGDFDYSAPTFNLGATYRLDQAAELYGGFSQGFALPDVGAYTRRAGLSTAFACPVANPNCLPAARRSVTFQSIAPEAQIVNSYELGIRGGNGPFRGSLAGFISTSERGVTFDPITNTISQQKEFIYGTEVIGQYALTERASVGGNATYREGRYDSNKDGRLDSWLPNNRIATPFRTTIWGSYLFDGGVSLRLEGEAWSGRDARIDLVGNRYGIKPGVTMNAALSAPIDGGEAYFAVNNLLDAQLVNPTATSVRNLAVYSWGRTVTLGYRKTF